MNNTTDVFKNCHVDGNVIKMTRDEIPRELYLDVKKVMSNNGGKWKGGKVWGFEFTHDPSSILNRLQGGEDVNRKKELQFFETPREIADEMVKWAEIPKDKFNPNFRVLEPSAGHGAILDALIDHMAPLQDFYAIEKDPDNFRHMVRKYQNKASVRLINTDFLEFEVVGGIGDYQRILMNPPFSGGQDIEHIMHAFSHLKPDGILVAVCGIGAVQNQTPKKVVQFQQWLDDLDAVVMPMDVGSFKTSGTMVNTAMIKIKKPYDY